MAKFKPEYIYFSFQLTSVSLWKVFQEKLSQNCLRGEGGGSVDFVVYKNQLGRTSHVY